MIKERFSWCGYKLRLKVIRPAWRLWDREKPTWYAVTAEPPIQIWRVCEDSMPLTATFMRTAPDLETAQRLAENHWESEIERGLHEDAFPLAPEPTMDFRPKPFWSSRDHRPGDDE